MSNGNMDSSTKISSTYAKDWVVYLLIVGAPSFFLALILFGVGSEPHMRVAAFVHVLFVRLDGSPWKNVSQFGMIHI